MCGWAWAWRQSERPRTYARGDRHQPQYADVVRAQPGVKRHQRSKHKTCNTQRRDAILDGESIPTSVKVTVLVVPQVSNSMTQHCISVLGAPFAAAAERQVRERTRRVPIPSISIRRTGGSHRWLPPVASTCESIPGHPLRTAPPTAHTTDSALVLQSCVHRQSSGYLTVPEGRPPRRQKPSVVAALGVVTLT